MLSLNLLPSKFSHEIKIKNLFYLVVRSGFILLLAVAVVAVSFFVANKILKNFYDVVSNTSFLIQTQIESPIEVREVNRKVREASAIQESSFPWLRSLAVISRNLPRGIYVESLDIDKEEEKVNISGIALTRESLVYLRDNLRNSDSFSELDLPLENILKKENIYFELEVKMNMDKIEQQ